MRRPPEVGQAGLLLMLLLGASGCAGVPQQATGSSSWPPGADANHASPPGLFSWWHRSGTQADAAPEAPSRMSETARTSQADSDSSKTATSPWPETQSEWTARNFPRFNRLWNGTPAGSPPARPDGNDVAWTNRTPDQSPATDVAVTASVPRSDGAVRPTDGASPTQDDSRSDRSRSRPQYLDNLPFSATPPPVKSPRQSSSEPASDTASSESGSPASAGQDASDDDEARPASYQPDDDSAPTKGMSQQNAGNRSAVSQASAAPAAFEEILPAPALAGPQEPATDGRAAAAATDASIGAKGAASLPADAGAAPRPDTRLAQIPPAPPPVPRTPPAPSPSGGDAPAASPPTPPAAAPAAGADQTTAPPPPTTNPAPPATPAVQAPAATPAPASAAKTAPTAASVQTPFAASKQSVYASQPPMASAQPRHHLLGWLFHDDDGAAVAFRATSCGRLPHHVLVSPERASRGPRKCSLLRLDGQGAQEAVLLESLDSRLEERPRARLGRLRTRGRLCQCSRKRSRV